VIEQKFVKVCQEKENASEKESVSGYSSYGNTYKNRVPFTVRERESKDEFREGGASNHILHGLFISSGLGLASSGFWNMDVS
jgi:hypothetical protein